MRISPVGRAVGAIGLDADVVHVHAAVHVATTLALVMMSGAGAKKKRRTSGVIATSSGPRRSTCTDGIAQHAEPAAFDRHEIARLGIARQLDTRATPRKVKLSRSSHSQEGDRLGRRSAAACWRGADSERGGSPPARRCSIGCQSATTTRTCRRMSDSSLAEVALRRVRQRGAGGWRCSFPGARRSSSGRPGRAMDCRRPSVVAPGLEDRVQQQAARRARAPATSPSTESTRNGMSSFRISTTVRRREIVGGAGRGAAEARPCAGPSASRR